LVDGSYRVQDWLAILSSPALPWYGGLLALSSVVTVAFLMLGVVAAQSLRRPADDSARLVFQTAAWVAAVGIVSLAAVAAGTNAMTAAYHPAKAAATAGYWRSGDAPAMVFFAWP